MKTTSFTAFFKKHPSLDAWVLMKMGAEGLTLDKAVQLSTKFPQLRVRYIPGDESHDIVDIVGGKFERSLKVVWTDRPSTVRLIHPDDNSILALISQG